MDKYFKKVIVILFLLIISQIKPTFASHAAGADFTYVCLGSNNYEITLTFYRDCFGITPNTSMDIQITNGCGYPSQTVFLNQLGTEVEIANVCPGPFTNCNGGTVYSGYQKWTYRGTVSLPGECTWFIGHGEPARNASITTIIGNGSDIQYIFCMINNVGGICNSSPTFSQDPILNFCSNQLLLIDPVNREFVGDSISLELIVPRTGPGVADTVTYRSGYSHTQPLICNSPMSFDPVTGIFQGIPSQVDVSIYAMVINEYRNGILIGQVESDMMISAGNCTNTIPILNGFNGTQDYTIDVFANQSNCFFISALDPNATNQTTIEYEYSIPGMTLTSSGGQRDTGFFCWTPTLVDTAFGPYIIRVKVTDGNCPYLGISSRNYYINVLNAVGVEDIDQNNVSIWPNPFNSEINLSSSILGKVELNLFDIQGRRVMNSIISESNSIIKLNTFEEGIYLLSIKSLNSGHTFWKRLLKN